jgi:hypothetical protein
MLAVYCVLLFYATWSLYLALCPLKCARDQGRLTPAAKVFGYPLLAVFMVLDVTYNLTVGTLTFLELPHELLFTSRLQRHLKDDPATWRYKVADWLCTNLLDPFDPSGSHCKRARCTP